MFLRSYFGINKSCNPNRKTWEFPKIGYLIMLEETS